MLLTLLMLIPCDRIMSGAGCAEGGRGSLRVLSWKSFRTQASLLVFEVSGWHEPDKLSVPSSGCEDWLVNWAGGIEFSCAEVSAGSANRAARGRADCGADRPGPDFSSARLTMESFQR